METQKIYGVAILTFTILFCCTMATPDKPNPFIGQWGLYLAYDIGSNAGWLDVRQEQVFLDGDLLWRWGSVEPVASMLMKDNTLVVTRTFNITRKKDAAGQPVRTHTLTSWFEFQLQDNDNLTGKAYLPDGDSGKYEVTEFTGKRLPPMPKKPDLSKVKFGTPVQLFNGVDLTGWTMVDARSKNGFVVLDGVMVNDPVQQEGKPHINYGNLRTVQEFNDFNLKLQVNLPAGSNSGIYLRGLYEIQVADSYGKGLDSHNMGGVYSLVTPTASAEKPAGEWQDMDMTLCDRHVTVKLNGVTIIDNQPVPGVTGGALTADVGKPGPIFLQGDHGKVLYKNILLAPIVK
jgi:hypothetical protein